MAATPMGTTIAGRTRGDVGNSGPRAGARGLVPLGSDSALAVGAAKDPDETPSSLPPGAPAVRPQDVPDR